MAEAERAPVLGDDPQPDGLLAGRLALPQHLEGDRHEPLDEEEPHEHQARAALAEHE